MCIDQDTHDLFATLIVSLNLTTHRQYFKTYHNSFTTDEAAENLSALKFSQSNRVPDPNEPSRIVTTTTTTTFSMNREMAKGICQHFMDARLIENAGDTTSSVFKDKGVYVLTPKGLHILERFITKNGINGEHLLKVFSSQPICMKLLHLERRLSDDELLINGPVLEVIFRRVAGRSPNYNQDAALARPSPETSSNFDRAMGIEVADIQEKVKGQGLKTFRHTFHALAAIDWLCDFTTVCGKDEAAEIAAHFVRVGLLTQIVDKSRREQEPYDDRDVIVRVDDGRGNVTEGHFRCHHKTIYGVTERGRLVARWDQPAGTDANGSFRANGSHRRRSSDTFESGLAERGDGDAGVHPAKAAEAKSKLADIPSSPNPSNPKDRTLSRKASTVDRSRGEANGHHVATVPAAAIGQGIADTSAYSSRDSNTNRLKNILEEPALRLLFREFLRQNFCEENLSFWLDVQDFKRRFHTTSSAMAVRGPAGPAENGAASHKTGMGRKLGRTLTGALSGAAGEKDKDAPMPGYTAMERHQQDLVSMAFVIFNTYLAPASPSELNIEHNLRAELVVYMNKILAEAKAAGALTGALTPGAGSAAQTSTPPSEAGGSVFASSAANRSETSLEEKKASVASQRIRIPLHASQLQTMVRLYDRIQDHIFQLMATDSVPRFIKDPRFVQLVKSVEEYTEALEAGRIDPHENAGPAIGREVVEAMQLRSSDLHGGSKASSSHDGGSRQSGDASSRKVSATTAATSTAPSAPASVASPKMEAGIAR
ncbi:probable Regulator of G-Protein Signaling Protein [Pseudozyma flocculosa]|uniref:Probable Regulator of G-Protein Signaling Protein n=1 Tax=Pseudozyma flocculosa TaxID=84751 RepID=A0A5C3F7M0_9BASI|nr:probable Regulator of G-Protein Signaling Protein [Pseudozyma flocculosa]